MDGLQAGLSKPPSGPERQPESLSPLGARPRPRVGFFDLPLEVRQKIYKEFSSRMDSS